MYLPQKVAHTWCSSGPSTSMALLSTLPPLVAEASPPAAAAPALLALGAEEGLEPPAEEADRLMAPGTAADAAFEGESASPGTGVDSPMSPSSLGRSSCVQSSRK